MKSHVPSISAIKVSGCSLDGWSVISGGLPRNSESQCVQNYELSRGTQLSLRMAFKCVIGTNFSVVSRVFIVIVMRAG